MNKEEIQQWKFIRDAIEWIGNNCTTPQSDELYEIACKMKGDLAKEIGYRMYDEYASCKDME